MQCKKGELMQIILELKFKNVVHKKEESIIEKKKIDLWKLENKGDIFKLCLGPRP